MTIHFKRSLIGLALAVGLSAATTAAPATAPEMFKTKGFTVISSAPGPSGMTAWTVKKGDLQTVLFTTPDGKTVVSGIMWDATSGSNVSDKFIPAQPNKPMTQPQQQPQSSAALQGMLDKNQVAKPNLQNAATAKNSAPVNAQGIPIAIESISKLKGFKEGSGSYEKTIYVVFDPRCQYCHRAFERTRDLTKQGFSIKWIPVVLLGDQNAQAQSVQWIEEAFAMPDPMAAMNALINGKLKGKAPSKDTIQALISNEVYFQESYRNNPNAGQPGVPTAYYLTSSGIPNMLGGFSEPEIIKQVTSTVRK